MKEYRVRLKEIEVCETIVHANSEAEATELASKGQDWGRKSVDFYVEDISIVSEKPIKDDQ